MSMTQFIARGGGKRTSPMVKSGQRSKKQNCKRRIKAIEKARSAKIITIEEYRWCEKVLQSGVPI